MKILQINNFHYLRGGSDKMYLETSQLLEENGHEVISFSSKHPENLASDYEPFFVEPVDFYKKSSLVKKVKNGLRFIYNVEAEEKLEALILKERPDLAHLHIFQSRLSSAVLKVLKKNKIPVVMSVHEYKLLCPVYTLVDKNSKVCERCKGGKFINCTVQKCNKGNLIFSFLSSAEAYYRNLFFPFEQYIDKFIMVSNFVYNKHIEFYPRMKKQAVVLYNFVRSNDQLFSTHKSGYLYFGRLSKEKGIMTILQAFKDFPQYLLTIAGEGEMHEDIIEYIKVNELKNVVLTGFVKGNALQEIVANSKFVIVSSEWYEPFGLTIIESFLSGTPVIGADIGAIPELIMHGLNGFIYKHGNAESLKEEINKAEILTKEEYIKMSDKGRVFASTHFNKNDYYYKLINIYKEVINEHSTV